MSGTSLGHPPTRPPHGPPLSPRLSLKDEDIFGDSPVLLQGGSIDDLPVVFENGTAESVFRPPPPVPINVSAHGSSGVVRVTSSGLQKERHFSLPPTPPERGCDDRMGYLVMENRGSKNTGSSFGNPSPSRPIPMRSSSRDADYEYAIPQLATHSASHPNLSSSLPRLKVESYLDLSSSVPSRPPPLPPHSAIAPPLSPSHFWSTANGDEEYDMPLAPREGMARKGLQSPPPPPQHVPVPESGSPLPQISSSRNYRPSMKRAEIHPIPTGVAYTAPQTFGSGSGLRNSLKRISNKLPLVQKSPSASDNEDSWDQPLPPPLTSIQIPHQISNFESEHPQAASLDRSWGTTGLGPGRSINTRGSRSYEYDFPQVFSNNKNVDSTNRTSAPRPFPHSRDPEFVIPPPPPHVPIPEDKTALSQSSDALNPPRPMYPKFPSEPELGPAPPPKNLSGGSQTSLLNSVSQILPMVVRSPSLSRKNSTEKVNEGGSMSPRLSWGHRRMFSGSGQGKGPEIGPFKFSMEGTPSSEALNRDLDATGRRGSAGSQSVEKKTSGLRRIMSLQSRGIGSMNNSESSPGNSQTNSQSSNSKAGRLSGSGADLTSPSCVMEESHYGEISPHFTTPQTGLGGHHTAANSVTDSHSGKGKKRDKIKAMLKSLPHHHHRRDTETDNQWWLHPHLSRTEAEAKIRGKPQGTFLVRPSSGGDSYSLSIVTSSGDVIHLLIGVESDGSVRLGGDACTFVSLKELVKHYRKNKLVVNGHLDTVLRKQVDGKEH